MDNTITKRDLVNHLHETLGLNKVESKELVETFFNEIKRSLKNNEEVKISGFGNFSIRDKATRMGRNPQTGEAMPISARRVLTFKPSQILRDDITERFKHRIDKEGKEDLTLPPKEGKPRALSSFLNNEDDGED